MSLDVHLIGPSEEIDCRCPNCGDNHKTTERKYYHDANITHNLGKMAAAAGLYVHLWRPEELGITKASQLIAPLSEGLEDLKARPDFFKTFNSNNGWGLYEHFVSFVQDYLNSCIKYPEAEVSVSR